MSISELIAKLEKIRDRKGDIPVCVSDYNDGYGGTFGIEVETFSDHVRIDPDGFEFEPE